MNCKDYLESMDKHINKDRLYKKIKDNEVIVVKDKDNVIGWLRFNYFWDNIPMMNMLFLEQPYRGKKIGKALVKFWEEEMRKQSYEQVMTSTQADEHAQHFYRKLAYNDSGCLVLETQALEIILIKQL
ncbi:GNAT family N-acetyltransferase [Vallitalea pronyensis]|uniref:GNAT family N-acetyltransferase n=2 Tax=Vallitalea pronyensis TaxID=1348613 RepID=A0A8J8MQL2_9FIRM|nr:GNAT family N-acetyltransferase [Vallitalea pronyensis]